MNMLRMKIYSELLEWKDRAHKPLVITGQRQVGKTYIVREFAERQQKHQELGVTARYVRREIARKQICVGTGDVDVGIVIRLKGIDGAFPILHRLNLVEENIDPLSRVPPVDLVEQFHVIRDMARVLDSKLKWMILSAGTPDSLRTDVYCLMKTVFPQRLNPVMIFTVSGRSLPERSLSR